MTIHAAEFRELRLDRLSRDFRSRQRPARRHPDDRQGRVHRPARPVRLRQVDDAEHHRRPAAGDRRRHLARRAPHRPAAAGRARLRHGVPELRAVPAYERAQEHRLRPDDARRAARRGRSAASTRRSALVRLHGQEHKLPGQLSGGQQQRVAIARAIVVEPPLVLMDEPLSNLDAKLRLEMRAEIRRIHNTLGATTIYVTHDQEEALSLADRIVVMRDGEVRQVGTPEDLFARPGPSRRRRVHGLPQPGRRPRRVASRRGGAVVDRRRRARRRPHPRAGRARATRPWSRSGPTTCTRSRPATAASSATVASSEFRGREFVGFAPHGGRHRPVLPGRRAASTPGETGASRRRPGPRARLLGRRGRERLRRDARRRRPLSQRLAARGLDSLTLLVVPAVLFVLALFIYPFLYGLLLSFQPKAGAGSRQLHALLLRPLPVRHDRHDALARAAGDAHQPGARGADRLPRAR